MKTVSLKLPDPLFMTLSRMAAKKGESRSALIREAVETFVMKESSGTKASCLDMAKDLAGCIGGPEDLSFNKDRLRGYGE